MKILNAVFALDKYITLSLVKIHRRWKLLDVFFTGTAKWTGYGIWIIVAVFLLKEEDGNLFFQVILSAVIARLLFVEGIRLVGHRKRPYKELEFLPLFSELTTVPSIVLRLPFFSYFKQTANYSFPSAHMALYTALAWSILFTFEMLGGLLFVAIVSMGIGRIYTGLHWFSDVVAGMALGVVAAFLALQIVG